MEKRGSADSARMRRKKRQRNRNRKIMLCTVLAGLFCSLMLAWGLLQADYSRHQSSRNHGRQQSADAQEATPQNGEDAQTQQEEDTTQPPEPEKTSVTLVAVGDMLGHESVIFANKVNNVCDYNVLFQEMKQEFTQADIAVINQETMFGGDEFPYAGYPNFNSPSEIGDAEVAAGFDVILHASNHARDVWEEGILNCISYWKTNHPEITYLGIHDSFADQENIRVLERNGIRIAMLNYTYGLNGYQLSEGHEYLVDLIDQDRIVSDIRRAKEMADAVVVFPHWGVEYVYEANAEQQALAQAMADAGADLIIGTHPHVLQNIEWLTGADGNRCLCYYSLGNYISGQTAVPRLLGGMANVTITKQGEEVQIESATLVPIVTHYEWRSGVYTAKTYRLSKYDNTLAARHSILSYDSTFTKEKVELLAEQIVGAEWIEP